MALHFVLSLPFSVQASSVAVDTVFSKTLGGFCEVHWGSHH